MKTTFENIQNIDERITTTLSEIEEVKNLPFYNIFKRFDEQERELKNLNHLLETLKDKKLKMLDKLEFEIQKERSLTQQLRYVKNHQLQ